MKFIMYLEDWELYKADDVTLKEEGELNPQGKLQSGGKELR